MNDRLGVLTAAWLAALAFLVPQVGGAQEHQSANWSEHELDFQYMGFTSHYSCSGLEGEMRRILLKLGARDDKFMVTPGVCGGFDDRPSRIAGVHLKLATLQPVVGANPAQAVDAYWKPVTIGGNSSDADCELIEQIRSDILPLFTTRNIQPANADCIPHEEPTVPASLRLEVLSLPPPAK